MAFRIQFIAGVIGKLINAFPGVEFGRLHYRQLEETKSKLLCIMLGTLMPIIMNLSQHAQQELEWWSVNLIDTPRRLKQPAVTSIFPTDVSVLLMIL